MTWATALFGSVSVIWTVQLIEALLTHRRETANTVQIRLDKKKIQQLRERAVQPDPELFDPAVFAKAVSAELENKKHPCTEAPKKPEKAELGKLNWNDKA